jgi:hypothetical protein
MVIAASCLHRTLRRRWPLGCISDAAVPGDRAMSYAAVVSGLLLLLGLQPAAASQHPLCPDPTANDTYFYVCRPGMQSAIAKVLYDFTVDHLYRPPAPFERKLPALLQAVGLDVSSDPDDPKLRSLFEQRGNVEFTRLDESSGEFVIKGPQADTVAVERTFMNNIYKVDLALPETIQGLYWRSPIHLELMFYKGHGVHLRLSSGTGPALDQDVLCLSVTPERTRVVTADPTHRHLVMLYEDCQ